MLFSPTLMVTTASSQPTKYTKVVKPEVNGLLSFLTKCLSVETDGDFDSVNSSLVTVNTRRAPATKDRLEAATYLE
jgi:hypothetical protein